MEEFQREQLGVGHDEPPLRIRRLAITRLLQRPGQYANRRVGLGRLYQAPRLRLQSPCGDDGVGRLLGKAGEGIGGVP